VKNIFLLFIFIGIKRTKIKKFFNFSVILIVCHLENLKTIMCLLFKVIQKIEQYYTIDRKVES